MTKKEIVFLAVFANLMALLLFLPLLTADAGLTSLHLQAYDVDENDTLYLLANQQIRIVLSDGKVNKFRSPLSRPDAIDVDGQFIYIYSGNKYAQMNISGEVIERGSSVEKSETKIRRPVRKGDSVYQYRSILGFYKITKETNGIKTDRYLMPASDAVIRAIQMIGIVIFVAFCIGFPLYFLTRKRFAKDGTILNTRPTIKSQDQNR